MLFKPLKLGALNLEHRVMMAPLTRMRGTKESDGVYVPSDLNVEYYSQRASKGGFQLTEACPISRLVSPLSTDLSGGLSASNTFCRLVVILECLEYLPRVRLQDGSESRMPSTPKAASFTVSYGMWVAQPFHPFLMATIV